MPRTVIVGEPGETWTNDTGKVLWQLKVSFFNSCGLCISQANHISTWFPIPFHRGCACSQTPVAPGHSAAPFIDFEAAIRDLPKVQRQRVMGKGLWQLVDSGAVDYSAAVTKARVRTLAEVVAREKLSVADLTRAGLTQARAELAYASAHTEAISSAEQQQRAMVGILRGHGLSEAQIKAALATELAGRVGIKGKGGTIVKPPPPPPPPPPPKKPRVVQPAKPKLPKVPAVVPPPVVAKAAPKPTPGAPILPGRPIAERLTAWKDGDELVKGIVGMADEREQERVKLWAERGDLQRRFYNVNQDFKKKADREAATKRLQSEIDAIDNRRAELRLGIPGEVADRLIVPPGDRLGFTVRPAQLTMRLGSDYVLPDNQVMGRAAKVKNWLDRIVGRSGSGESPVHVDMFQFSDSAVRKRAHYSPGSMTLAASDGEATYVHEMGHGLEHQIPGLAERAREFRAHRVGTEKPTNMAAKFGADRYDAHEEGYEDDFGKFFSGSQAYYAGKLYDTGETEIISMGVEALYQNPIEFARKDPEYCKFILGALSGTLR